MPQHYSHITIKYIRVFLAGWLIVKDCVNSLIIAHPDINKLALRLLIVHPDFDKLALSLLLISPEAYRH